jgi:hypothetical protein
MASLHPESLSDEVDSRAPRAGPTYATAAEQLGLSSERVRQVYNEVNGRLWAHLKNGFEAYTNRRRIKFANGFSSVCDIGVTRHLIVTYIVTLLIFKNSELTSHWIPVP